jgi:hypothetical protein
MVTKAAVQLHHADGHLGAGVRRRAAFVEVGRSAVLAMALLALACQSSASPEISPERTASATRAQTSPPASASSAPSPAKPPATDAPAMEVERLRASPPPHASVVAHPDPIPPRSRGLDPEGKPDPDDDWLIQRE